MATTTSAKFLVECFGRNKKGNRVLKTPVNVEVTVDQPNTVRDTIMVSVEKCEHYMGRRQACRASNPDATERDRLGYCPFVCDIPLVVDNLKRGY